MTGTGIRGLGTENGDTVGAALFGVPTVAIDVVLLTRIRRWAGEQTAAEHRAAVTQTGVLAGSVLFAAVLGVAIAGQWSTPHRRWRCATLSAPASHLPLGLFLAVAGR
ncbi:hypothetical protein [Kitasatospora cathayae]|uniref:Membrane transport protein MMPL domain-containing protein n=1 Tax=Kitasatospora cathayae TaxID=3004092 RepID=A0ABY7PYN7_9ACTN|nr:hypothetical protein [Kitasatospora sp. HUAS 3-15]WBP85496.1 hypothetical protein O1G21_06265 [Kitasatospora sp. HUAS 3-15]